ncbi:hypothetical protein F503_02865 [Ophiostoma piceae UAMH 11346]|uniref:Uncharacterized protein n=1 Tax=Ophiostoma piceae (strain UAMH 11346) TaxID=1262450 RepID=S3C2P5_OPHP1|nr:hypothetical protein F503_02865 [Ophiostoma piceae UAMH 11346]
MTSFFLPHHFHIHFAITIVITRINGTQSRVSIHFCSLRCSLIYPVAQRRGIRRSFLPTHLSTPVLPKTDILDIAAGTAASSQPETPIAPSIPSSRVPVQA